jgi:hypothetical protein
MRSAGATYPRQRGTTLAGARIAVIDDEGGPETTTAAPAGAADRPASVGFLYAALRRRRRDPTRRARRRAMPARPAPARATVSPPFTKTVYGMPADGVAPRAIAGRAAPSENLTAAGRGLVVNTLKSLTSCFWHGTCPDGTVCKLGGPRNED